MQEVSGLCPSPLEAWQPLITSNNLASDLHSSKQAFSFLCVLCSPSARTCECFSSSLKGRERSGSTVPILVFKGGRDLKGQGIAGKAEGYREVLRCKDWLGKEKDCKKRVMYRREERARESARSGRMRERGSGGAVKCRVT